MYINKTNTANKYQNTYTQTLYTKHRA